MNNVAEIRDKQEIDRLRKADPFRPIHEETRVLVGWGTCVLRAWSANERGWQSDVSPNGDGAAAGNIVRDEVQVVAVNGGNGWTYKQRRRSVAINQSHVAHGSWEDEPLTWAP